MAALYMIKLFFSLFVLQKGTLKARFLLKAVKDGRFDVALNDKLFPNFRQNWSQRNGPQVFVSITNRGSLREGCDVRFLPRSWKATLQKGRMFLFVLRDLWFVSFYWANLPRGKEHEQDSRSYARCSTLPYPDQKDQTTTPGTTCPTLYDKCVGSFTSHRIMNIEGL